MVQASPEASVTSYLDHANRHDVEGALAHLSDDFELSFAGGSTLAKEGVANALGWHAGTKGRIDWRIVSTSDAEIEVAGEETNAFFRLLGMPPLRFRSRFRCDEAGRIVRQHHEVEWAGASLDEALSPVLAWAREHAPEELEAVYPDGRMVYSAEHGRRWIALLCRWREDSG